MNVFDKVGMHYMSKDDILSRGWMKTDCQENMWLTAF